MIEAILLAGFVCGSESDDDWATPKMKRYTTPYCMHSCSKGGVTNHLTREFNVISNALHSAGEHYWAAIKTDSPSNVTELACDYNDSNCKEPYMRVPCGGDVGCNYPLLADSSICWVDQTECWTSFTEKEMNVAHWKDFPDAIVIRTFVLECSGLLDCKREKLPSEFCCETLEVIEHIK